MAGSAELTWREELRANARVLGLSMRAAPVLATGMYALTIVEGLFPAILVERTGRFISLIGEAVGGGSGSRAAADARAALIAIAVVITAGQLIKPMKSALQYGVGRAYQQLLARRVMRGVTEIPGIAHFEDPSFRDQIEVHEWMEWAPAHQMFQVGMVVQSAITALSMAAVTARFAGWAPALLLATAIPAGVAAFNRVRVAGLALWQDTPDVRRAGYLRNLAINLSPAKELRIFGLKDWTLARQAKHWFDGYRETWRKRRQGTVLVAWLHVLELAGVIAVYAAILNRALAGTASPEARAGAFVATSLAAVGVATSTTASFTSAAWIRRMNYMLPYVLRLFDLARTDPRMEATGTAPARGRPATGIAFEGVRFRYPGTERWILTGIDLRIEPGTSVALVGENGAGKTTLIKLLCRFYDPTEGRITIDGVDIRELDIDDYRRRLAAIFQDFTRYELSARDNIGFGAVERRHEDELVREAARRVGVLEEIERSPQGWDTPLARGFSGVDLSGGQWQRIALGRAIMAQLGNDADVLILDEPTASLDVRLEHELYEHFAELSQDRTTLLVSHRFSTVRMADRIVMMEGGRIVEDGTHASLLAQDGRYAELYRLQASHYQATGALE